MLLSQTTESSNVVVAGKVELTFLLLMDIPENIEADSVHTQSLAHLDTMFPIGLGNTRIMNLGGLYHKGFAVEQESAFAHLECLGLLSLSECTARGQQSGNKQQKDFVSHTCF